MERRAGQLLHRALGAATKYAPGTLHWAGTFHSVGARLLREYAARIGLQESFTILDRGDAEDLMAIARHEHGFDATQRRFPTKATCLGIYSRVVNGETALREVLERSYPWCVSWEAELKKLFATYVHAKQAQNVLDYDDLLLYWSYMVKEPSLAREIGERSRRCAGRRVTGHESASASILLASSRRQGRYGGRRRTVDRCVRRGDGAQHPRLSAPVRAARPVVTWSATTDRRRPSSMLQRRDRLAAERFTKNLWTDGSRPASRDSSAPGRSRSGALCGRARLEQREQRYDAEIAGGVSEVRAIARSWSSSSRAATSRS